MERQASMNMPIRIILADEHALVVEGLRRLLEQMPDFSVVATARNGHELLHLLEEHKADVLVLDLQMSYHGMTVLAQIRQRDIAIRVLILTASSDSRSIQTALELAAAGFVLKTESPLQTIEAIRQVAQGHLLFHHAAQTWLATGRGEPHDALSVLSPRENEMLAYMAKGYSNPRIAAALSISVNTVRYHLKNIFVKLDVTNRTEAVAWYLKHHKSAQG